MDNKQLSQQNRTISTEGDYAVIHKQEQRVEIYQYDF